MLLGIDVGGTFTDAVVISGHAIAAKAKVPTTSGCLIEGIVSVLDKVLQDINASFIKQVALSTTAVTNALVTGNTDKVDLYVVPGPGMDISGLVPELPVILSGYTDHRGRIVAELDKREVVEKRGRHKSRVCAVSGKFSVRNPQHEHTIANWLTETNSFDHISIGSELSGSLNFLRRTNSAYFNAAVWRLFNDFATAINSAIVKRGIKAPVYILKADGGTMPLASAKKYPVEAIFTGPAASVLGIMAQHKPMQTTVSLDIGGTTTDVAFWYNGVPLYERNGAVVKGCPTAVPAFWLRSVGIGGDSAVRREGTRIIIGPERQGPAMAVGGSVPTVTDAMIITGRAEYGDWEKAYKAMQLVSLTGEMPERTAKLILESAANKICTAIEEMVREKIAEPVYNIDDVIHRTELKVNNLVGVGGAARGLVPLVGQMLGVTYEILPQAEITNAIGAAVARPTLEITVQADTGQGSYTVPEIGLKTRLPKGRITMSQMEEIAQKHLSEYAAAAGISVAAMEVLYREEFNIVRDYVTTGKILSCKLQVKPGVLVSLSDGEKL